MSNQIRSTLRFIEPTDTIEAYSKNSLHSIRSNGTFIQLLNRPTKYLETSRGYVHGDPVNFIDWKVYARTESLTIREQKEESSANIKITGDISGSMKWPTKRDLELANAKFAPRKVEICLRLILNIAYQHISAGDKVHIYLKTDEGIKALYLRTTSDILAIYSQLLLEGFQEECLSKYYQNPNDLITTNVKVEYYFSDLIGQNSEHSFVNANFKIFIHILSSLERDIDWIRSSNRLIDDKIDPNEYDGGTLQKKYIKSLTDWCENIRSKMDESGVKTVEVDDSLSVADYGIRMAEALV